MGDGIAGLPDADRACRQKAELQEALAGPAWKRLWLPPSLEEGYHQRRREVSLEGIRSSWPVIVFIVAVIGTITFASGMVEDLTRGVVIFGYAASFFSIALVAAGASVRALNPWIDDLMVVAAFIALGGMQLGAVVAPEGGALRSTAEYGVIFITIAICTITAMPLRRALLTIVGAMLFLLVLSQYTLQYPGSLHWIGLPPVFNPVIDGFTPDWQRFPFYGPGSIAIASVIGIAHDIRERTVYLQQELLGVERRELAVLSQELSVLSRQDALTGLANRRHFDEVLAREWAVCTRECMSISLLFIDVDYFKRYNDHYGHQAGDECLARVAAALEAEAKRGADFIARYGGEEFVGFFPRTNAQGLDAIARRMIDAVDALGIPHQASGAASHVTISVGGAVVIPSPGQSPDVLVELADAALYRAKQGGRHRIEMAGMAE